MVQFDPDLDHLFWSHKGSAVWSGGGFTPVILVWIKLKSQKVRTKRGRCERALSLRQKANKRQFPKCRTVPLNWSEYAKNLMCMCDTVTLIVAETFPLNLTNDTGVRCECLHVISEMLLIRRTWEKRRKVK